MNAITSFRGEYRWLSNFAAVEVVMDGEAYASVEHAYQAAKTFGEHRAAIRKAETPGKAKKLGRRAPFDRRGWRSRRCDVMMSLLRQKFALTPFRQNLLATGDAQIIEENDWGDEFWGVYKGQGQNMLGKLIMQVRYELRQS